MTLEEVIDAFYEFKNRTAYLSQIKQLLYERNGNSHFPHKTKYTFDQTIQGIINRHCAKSSTFRKFGGTAYFFKVETGLYQLIGHYSSVGQLQTRTEVLLNSHSQYIDHNEEAVLRNMREINQINRNQRIASALKQLYDFKCQICHIAIMIDSNKYYIEVHHLKPLGIPHNGPDIIENMIVVCPNCHVKLDYKALELDLNNLIMKEPHKIQEQFVDYQNKKIVG